jgi:cell division protein FtsB
MPAPRGTFAQRILSWRFLFVVNFVVIILLSLSLGKEVVRNSTIQSEIESLQVQAAELADENSQISELQSALQSESYIEREARLKLGMKKPGESVVVIQDEGSILTSGGTMIDSSDPLGLVITDDVSQQHLANHTKWWYYFFNKQAYSIVEQYE